MQLKQCHGPRPVKLALEHNALGLLLSYPDCGPPFQYHLSVSPILEFLFLDTRRAAKEHAMIIGISSKIDTTARTRIILRVGENAEIFEKYARRLKSIRTPRSSNATINAKRTIVSPNRGLPLSLALLAVRRNRQRWIIRKMMRPALINFFPVLVD